MCLVGCCNKLRAQAELQTDRQKVVLFDSSATPILSLSPGARHDFIVAHDVKEVGPHTLACSTVYITAAGERKYYPQYFKFASHNPLSVRTKVPVPAGYCLHPRAGKPTAP